MKEQQNLVSREWFKPKATPVDRRRIPLFERLGKRLDEALREARKKASR